LFAIFFTVSAPVEVTIGWPHGCNVGRADVFIAHETDVAILLRAGLGRNVLAFATWANGPPWQAGKNDSEISF